MLPDPGVHLLTLTGASGVGKTRLAIAVGVRLLESFQDLETKNPPKYSGRTPAALQLDSYKSIQLVYPSKSALVKSNIQTETRRLRRVFCKESGGVIDSVKGISEKPWQGGFGMRRPAIRRRLFRFEVAPGNRAGV